MPSSPGDYDAVRKDIASILSRPGYDDGSIGPVLVRLSWHASGNYSLVSHTGGSNGAGMRFPPESLDPANAGLHNAITFLEPVKAKHDWISHSDLWTLAGVTAIRSLGGPTIPWTPGRTDYSDEQAARAHRGEDDTLADRLPDGAQGVPHLRDVFGRMGFSDQEIVALSGAHVLGRCHKDRSGFDGPWVTNPTRFSNQYYRLLLTLPWKERVWDGPQQFEATAVGKELMMLPSDMALLDHPETKKWVEVYAKDKDRFYDDFAKAFAKLLELGVDRSPDGYAHLVARAEEKGLSKQETDHLAPKEAFGEGKHKVVTQSGGGGGGCPFSGKSSRL